MNQREPKLYIFIRIEFFLMLHITSIVTCDVMNNVFFQNHL